MVPWAHLFRGMMNVTDRGYYTTQYLERQRQAQSNMTDSWNGRLPPVRSNSEDERIGISRADSSGLKQLDSSPPTVLTSPSSKRRGNYNEAKHRSRKLPSSTDELTEEIITPADLFHIQRRDASHIDGPSSNISGSNDFEGYYINQKKNFDVASDYDFVPKSYTHKTFHQIFDNKAELTDIYNPMEFVFDTKQPNNLKRVYQGMKVKLGKDNYNDYDYYNSRSLGNDQSTTQNKLSSVPKSSDQLLSSPANVTEVLNEENKKKKSFTLFKPKKKDNTKNHNFESLADCDPEILEARKDINNQNYLFNTPIDSNPLLETNSDKSSETELDMPSSTKTKKSSGWSKIVGLVAVSETIPPKKKKSSSKYPWEKWSLPANVFLKDEKKSKPKKTSIKNATGNSKPAIIAKPKASGYLNYVTTHPWYKPVEPYVKMTDPIVKVASPYASRAAPHLHPTVLANNIRKLEIFRILFGPLDRFAKNTPSVMVFIHFIQVVIFLWFAIQGFKIACYILDLFNSITSPFVSVQKSVVK